MFDWIQACFCLQNEPEPASRGLANLHIHCLGLLPFKQKSGVCDLLLIWLVQMILMAKVYLPSHPWDFFHQLCLLHKAKMPPTKKFKTHLFNSQDFRCQQKTTENKNPHMEEGERRINKSIAVETKLIHSEKKIMSWKQSMWLLLVAGLFESYTPSLFAKKVNQCFSNPAEQQNHLGRLICKYSPLEILVLKISDGSCMFTKYPQMILEVYHTFNSWYSLYACLMPPCPASLISFSIWVLYSKSEGLVFF